MNVFSFHLPWDHYGWVDGLSVWPVPTFIAPSSERPYQPKVLMMPEEAKMIEELSPLTSKCAILQVDTKAE